MYSLSFNKFYVIITYFQTWSYNEHFLFLFRINKVDRDFLYWQIYHLFAPWETKCQYFYQMRQSLSAYKVAGIVNKVNFSFEFYFFP